MTAEPQHPGGVFKVIWTDGYARETIAEHAVSENLSDVHAECVCEWLRAGSDWEGNWWVVVPQSQKLWRGMEEFV